MKRLSYYAMIGLLTVPILASAEVGVSINVGQPGFYGQINLGDAPRPEFIYAQPLWIYRGPEVEPIYLRVPPDHARHWGKYCRQYQACFRPVYFVRNSWYDRVYVPYYRQHSVELDNRYKWKHDNGEHRGWDKDRGGWDKDHGNHGEHHGHGNHD